jgi:hypothetical protein
MRSFTKLPTRIAAVLGLVACADVLGVQSLSSVQKDAGPALDAAIVACVLDRECDSKLPVTVPAGCAVARCRANTCVFAARDADGDGFSVACVSSVPQARVEQTATVDCDDAASGVVPGSEVDCTDGSFTLPGKGECRPGKRRCMGDGSFGACVGAVGKKPELCSNASDDDCDGNVNNGCACLPGDAQRCGPSQAGVGICIKGTQLCNAGAWGACTGAVYAAARDCRSSADNDCNGIADNQEAGCKCDMASLAGVQRACSTGMAGICNAGTETCTASVTGAVWAGCTANTAPQTRACASIADNDCNGVSDQAETACKCDGTVAIGGRVLCLTNPVTLYKTCQANGAIASYGGCGS